MTQRTHQIHCTQCCIGHVSAGPDAATEFKTAKRIEPVNAMHQLDSLHEFVSSDRWIYWTKWYQALWSQWPQIHRSLFSHTLSDPIASLNYLAFVSMVSLEFANVLIGTNGSHLMFLIQSAGCWFSTRLAQSAQHETLFSSRSSHPLISLGLDIPVIILLSDGRAVFCYFWD